MNNYNGLTLPEVSKYVNPTIATQLSSMCVKDLHKMKIHTETPLFDFIEYVSKTFYGLEKDYASFRHRKSSQFFKRIWLYVYTSNLAMFSYNKTRYGLLIKNENIDDLLISKVTFDYFWEKLSENELPVMTETFEHYLDIVNKEGSLFTIERMYEESGIDRSWGWLEDHLKERIRKA